MIKNLFLTAALVRCTETRKSFGAFAFNTHFDAGGSALGDGVWNGGSGRIDHRHESDEPQSRQREILRIGVELVRRRISTVIYLLICRLIYVLYREHRTKVYGIRI